MKWIRALHIRERYIAKLMERLQEQEAAVHRLETHNRALHERMEYLEAAQERLLARFKGNRGGRPPNQPDNPLAAVAPGDKAALRRVLLNGNKPPKGDHDA